MESERVPITIRDTKNRDVDNPQNEMRMNRIPIRQRSQTFQKLLQTSSHHMNILDAHKLEADIRVVVLILIAFPCRTICQCIQLQKHKKCLRILLWSPNWLEEHKKTSRCSTLGRVSITYIYRLLWLALLMAWSMCSSSKHRALKPERGWLHRHTAAWRHDTNKYKCSPPWSTL